MPSNKVWGLRIEIIKGLEWFVIYIFVKLKIGLAFELNIFSCLTHCWPLNKIMIFKFILGYVLKQDDRCTGVVMTLTVSFLSVYFLGI